MRKLKIKLRVSETHLAEIEKYFQEKGIEISEDAEYLLTESSRYAEYLMGKKNGIMYRIEIDNIVFIESFGKNIIVHTSEENFNIVERLKELELLLDPKQFIRISNSVIISRSCIRSIQPTFGMKFILTLTNGSKVDVTRSYYYIFREAFGI